MAALAVLVISGVLAGIELWRSWRARRVSGDPFHLVLSLAIITLGLTIVADELGIRTNHRELQLTASIPDISTPQAWSHAHIILNHIPTAGIVFAIAFFVAALVANNDVQKRASLALFVICAILGVPTYVTGAASMWALTGVPGISRAVINAHRDMALLSLFVVVPSLSEPFGMTALEAALAGKTSVVTELGGTKEFVLDQQTGLVVNPRKTKSFASAMELLLDDRDLRKSMGERARERALEAFTPKQSAFALGRALGQ